MAKAKKNVNLTNIGWRTERSFGEFRDGENDVRENVDRYVSRLELMGENAEREISRLKRIKVRFGEGFRVF